MQAIFTHYDVDYKGNLLWGYCDTTLAYVYQKYLIQPITLHSRLSQDFILSVTKKQFQSTYKGRTMRIAFMGVSLAVEKIILPKHYLINNYNLFASHSVIS